MTFIHFFCLGIFAFLQQVSGYGTEFQPELYSSGIINDYADRIIKLVRPAMVKNGFDPFKVDDISRDFWFKPLFINYTGHIDLKNGWLQDLSTIYRLGDAEIKYEKKLLTIHVELMIDCLMANFDYTMKVFNIGPSGRLSAIVRKQAVQFSLLVDFERLTFHLQQFALTSHGQVKLNISGLGLIDPILGVIVDALTAIFKNSVIKNIGYQIRSAIEEIFEKLPPLLPPAPTQSVNVERNLVHELLARINHLVLIQQLGYHEDAF